MRLHSFWVSKLTLCVVLLREEKQPECITAVLLLQALESAMT
jgi:hypothetical protein